MQEGNTRETEVQETTSQNSAATTRRPSATQAATPKQNKMPTVVLIQRVIWFIVGLINTLIALRFTLLLLGANRDVPFTDFIYSVSEPFVSPFIGIFGQPVYGRAVFEISSLFAIIIYLLIGLGITKALTLTRPQDEI